MKTLLSADMSGSSAESYPPGSSLSISSMSFGHRASVDAVECPKCGKRSIVERSSNIFDCLNCSFHRELPPVGRRAGLGRSGLSRSGLGRSGLGRSTVSQLSASHDDIHQRGSAQRSALLPQSERARVTSFPSHASLSQRSSLNALFNADGQPSSLDRDFNRFSLEMEEEMGDADQSQPWVFAVIAVIFGILLL